MLKLRAQASQGLSPIATVTVANAPAGAPLKGEGDGDGDGVSGESSGAPCKGRI